MMITKSSVGKSLSGITVKKELKVVWCNVNPYYQPSKLIVPCKTTTFHDEEPEVNKRFIKLKPVVAIKDEVFFKHNLRSTSIQIQPTRRISEKKRQSERKVSKFDKIRRSSVIKRIPFYKTVINRVLNKLKSSNDFSSFSFDSAQESFDSAKLDYHCISLVNRNSALVSTISSDSENLHEDELHVTNINRELIKIVPDMTNVLPAKYLMNIFLKEHYLKLPLLNDELDNYDLYEAGTKTNVIYKMLKTHTDMFPLKLVDILKKHKRIGDTEPMVIDKTDKDAIFYTSLNKSFSTILEEISLDMISISHFFYPLFKYAFDRVQPLDFLIEFHDEKILKAEISRLSEELASNINRPASLVRWKVMEFIRSCEENYILTILLMNSCHTWLNNLIKCIFSEFCSVRQEAIITLAYFMSRKSLTNELFNCRQYNVTYDIFVAVFRAMDQFPEDTEPFYCLTGFILEHSINMEILEYIIHKGPFLTNVCMRKRWPNLVYLALKYWPHYQMINQSIILTKIKKVMQAMSLRKQTKRAARMALCFLVKNFLFRTKLLTVWVDSDISNIK